MNEYKKHAILEQRLCKEQDDLEEKYKEGGKLTETDLKTMDLIYHTLKSKAGYEKMTMGPEYGQEMSGTYGRSYADQPMSMGMGRGYSGDGYSGHYMPYPYYPERRW